MRILFVVSPFCKPLHRSPLSVGRIFGLQKNEQGLSWLCAVADYLDKDFLFCIFT